MIQFVLEGGWPMYPVLALSLLAIVLAARYAHTSDKRLFPLVVGFTAAAMLVGCLGTVIGVQMSADGLHRVGADERWIFLLGLRESLNCLVAALLSATVVAMLTSMGSFRAAKAAGRSARVRA